jgi:acetate kinase
LITGQGNDNVTRTNALLVVNAGSSSLKFQTFSIDADEIRSFRRGVIDGIRARPRMVIQDETRRVVTEQKWDREDLATLPAAIGVMSDWVRSLDTVRLRAIGHRIVHGGPRYSTAVRITPAVLEDLAAYQELAPLHQPNNLAPIQAAIQIAPNLPQVGCFDTAFHRGHSEHTDCYALPRKFYELGVRRYGFHGLSYKYISRRLPEISQRLANGRVVVAHLGSGASMSALNKCKSIETTMGFTALDGLPMGTRPGQLDPGIVLFLQRHYKMTAEAVTKLLYYEAGLAGLSGFSADMRVLLKSEDPRAKMAIDHFVHRCGLHAGMMVAALGGIDGLVFTAGIGENSPEIRARIMQKMQWLGVELDEAANASNARCISAADSKVEVLVLRTDEEKVIAQETLDVLNLH